MIGKGDKSYRKTVKEQESVSDEEDNRDGLMKGRDPDRKLRKAQRNHAKSIVRSEKRTNKPLLSPSKLNKKAWNMALGLN